jgi:hypothetical protein
MSKSFGQHRGVPFGAVYVGLDLAERDRALRQATVVMEDRVERILPSLVRKALLGLAVIFDETVTVTIAVSFDPGERCLDVRSQKAHRCKVAGPPEILPEQQQEQGRRVDASIVAAERHLAQIRHFSMAHLVQNFPGLGVAFRRHRRRLGGGEKPEHAPRDVGIQPQGHQRRDDTVAPERGAEPPDPGIGVRFLGRVGDQHVQVRDGAPNHFVVDGVRAIDARGTGARLLEGMAGGAHLPVEQPAGPFAQRRTEVVGVLQSGSCVGTRMVSLVKAARCGERLR